MTLGNRLGFASLSRSRLHRIRTYQPANRIIFSFSHFIEPNVYVARLVRVFNGRARGMRYAVCDMWYVFKRLEKRNKRSQLLKSSRYPETGNSITNTKPHWFAQDLVSVSVSLQSAAGDRGGQGPGSNLVQSSEEKRVVELS
jgi:hypothetical protein